MAPFTLIVRASGGDPPNDIFLTKRPLNDDHSYSGSLMLDFIAEVGTLYALSPQQIPKFPPQNVPQPGDLLGGAGALLADAFKVK